MTLFFIFASFLIIRGENNYTQITQNPTTSYSDSTDIFNSITDIEKQIRGKAEEFEKEAILINEEASQPPQLSRNMSTLLDTIIRRTDSVNPLVDSILVRPDSVILGRDSLKIRDTPVISIATLYPQRKNYLDSLYTRRPNGTLVLPVDPSKIPNLYGLTFRDTMIINPLYLPMVFNGKMLPVDLDFYPISKTNKYRGSLIDLNNTFDPLLEDMHFVNDIRREYYKSNPDRIKYSFADFDNVAKVDVQSDVLERFNPFKELISTERNAKLDAPDVETVKIKRIYWIRSGEHSLQLSQNYFSDNWHRGGTSNLNINNYHVFRANYDKNKVKFNNTLEWRLSLASSPEDTLRDYRIGDDLIRYYGTLGIDAFLKKWSYSTNLEAKSQLFNNFPPNSKTLRSALLSPLYVNFGVGMRYSLDKKIENHMNRRVRLSIDLSPISLNYKYVGNEKVDVRRYGIPEGEKSLLEIGSTVNANMKFDLTKYITWDSRFKYFTSYKNVLAEFENTLNMSLSQYFSTRLYLHLRYDDGVPPDPTYKLIQVNELLSFGLNFRW